MKVDLTDLKNAVAEQKTVNESVKVLIDQIVAKLREIGSQPSVDPADLLALASEIKANNADIQAKVVFGPKGQHMDEGLTEAWPKIEK